LDQEVHGESLEQKTKNSLINSLLGHGHGYISHLHWIAE